VTDAPPALRRLAERRAEARTTGDFATADRLRDEIAAAGWVVRDTASSWELTPARIGRRLASVDDLPDHSADPDDHQVTVSVLIDGWPDDTRTCGEALLEHCGVDVVLQILDNASSDGTEHLLDDLATANPNRIQLWRAEKRAGWGAARRAMLRADTAAVHVWCDQSTVFDGDALAPLLDALTDESVTAVGWRGVDVDLDDNWRSVHDCGPGDADALLGYLLAVRRRAALTVGGPDPQASFYRNGDIEFSFLLRASAGGRLVVAEGPLPCHQQRHRGYHDTDAAYRDRESARNYRRFLRRFRGRTELLAQPASASNFAIRSTPSTKSSSPSA
jgi:GT2 family glycosyltransferase